MGLCLLRSSDPHAHLVSEASRFALFRTEQAETVRLLNFGILG